jgi:molybdenum cofactor biosynthesis enzyme MoaA
LHKSGVLHDVGFTSMEEVSESTIKNGLASRFRERRIPAGGKENNGAAGVVGFISPLTHHFCESCNRLRLTADGTLRPCLFSDVEVDVKAALRSGASDDAIAAILRLAVAMKPLGHTLNPERVSRNLRSMSKIGG